MNLIKSIHILLVTIMSQNQTLQSHSILSVLAYSDLFDYPLKVEETRRFLDVPCALSEVADCLSADERVGCRDGYYFLKRRDEIVDIRRERELGSTKPLKRAIFYGRIVGGLPFVRMVAITGSLATRNLSKNADMDFMLVTRRGRVWTARAFALLVGRIARLFGDVICPNVIVSESALEWDVKNLYAAREFAQMIPVSGQDVYVRLMQVNVWVRDFFPNFEFDDLPLKGQRTFPALQRLLEFLLSGWLGDLFEAWEMNRKIARFQKQAGYGLETQFNAEICQGNFDHHGAWAMEKYQARLKEILPQYSEINA
jgi:hypothetical protein